MLPANDSEKAERSFAVVSQAGGLKRIAARPTLA